MNPLLISAVFKAVSYLWTSRDSKDAVAETVVNVVADQIEDKLSTKKANAGHDSIETVEGLADLAKSPHVAQTFALVQESLSTSWFKSAWRPALAWVAVVGVALDMFVAYGIQLASYFFEIPFDPNELPRLPAEQLYSLLGILLTGATLRTFEKAKGITN